MNSLNNITDVFKRLFFLGFSLIKAFVTLAFIVIFSLGSFCAMILLVKLYPSMGLNIVLPFYNLLSLFFDIIKVLILATLISLVVWVLFYNIQQIKELLVIIRAKRKKRYSLLLQQLKKDLKNKK